MVDHVRKKMQHGRSSGAATPAALVAAALAVDADLNLKEVAPVAITPAQAEPSLTPGTALAAPEVPAQTQPGPSGQSAPSDDTEGQACLSGLPAATEGLTCAGRVPAARDDPAAFGGARVEKGLGAADADPQPAAHGSETCELELDVAGVFLNAQPTLTCTGLSYYNTAATQVAPPAQATPPPEAAAATVPQRQQAAAAKFISRIEANVLAGSSLPEVAAANMLAIGEEMVDAALAASQKRKAHITGAPQPKNWIPEFQITEQGKATWCGIEVQRGHNDRVWTKWEDEWYYLEGPDPRFNVWDRARHSWVKSWVRAPQERLGLELRKQLRMNVAHQENQK